MAVSSYRSIYTRTVVSLMFLFGSTGCFLTSPYHGQRFQDRSTPIPLQAWVEDPSGFVDFQCRPASETGPREFRFNEYHWRLIERVPVSTAPIYDSQGQKMYSASAYSTLPRHCWAPTPDGSGNATSAIRAKRESLFFGTFSRDGLACLGRTNGLSASWFGWPGNNCVRADRYLIIKALAE